MVEQHQDRSFLLFFLFLFTADADIERQTVLALPVVLQDGALKFHLHGRGPGVFCLEHGLGRGERLGRFPAAFPDWRHGIGDAGEEKALLRLHADKGAGSCSDRTRGIIFALNGLILPVDLTNILLPERKDKALASVTVLPAHLTDLVPAYQHVQDKAQDRKQDDAPLLFHHILEKRDVRPLGEEKLEKNEDEKNHAKRRDSVHLVFLNRLAENDFADQLFQRHAGRHADHRARPARPAQKQRDLSAEAVAQCGDEGNHKIIKRKYFFHLFPQQRLLMPVPSAAV